MTNEGPNRPPLRRSLARPAHPPLTPSAPSVMPFVVGIVHFVAAALVLASLAMMMAVAGRIQSREAQAGVMVMTVVIGGLSFLLVTSGIGLVLYKLWARWLLLPVIVLLLATCGSGAMAIAAGRAGPVEMIVTAVYGGLLLLDFIAFVKLPDAVQARLIIASAAKRAAAPESSPAPTSSADAPEAPAGPPQG